MTIPSMNSLFEEQVRAGAGGGGSVMPAKPEPSNLDELLMKVESGHASQEELNFLLKHNFITMDHLQTLPFYQNRGQQKQTPQPQMAQPAAPPAPAPQVMITNPVPQAPMIAPTISNDVYVKLEEQKAIVEFLKMKLELAEKHIASNSEMDNAYKKEIVDLILDKMNDKTFAAIGFDIINQRENSVAEKFRVQTKIKKEKEVDNEKGE